MLNLGLGNSSDGMSLAGSCWSTLEELGIQMVHGTITLPFKFCPWGTVAADSRDIAGAYFTSQMVKKMIRIKLYLLGTMASGATDCNFRELLLAWQFSIYEPWHKGHS